MISSDKIVELRELVRRIDFDYKELNKNFFENAPWDDLLQLKTALKLKHPRAKTNFHSEKTANRIVYNYTFKTSLFDMKMRVNINMEIIYLFSRNKFNIYRWNIEYVEIDGVDFYSYKTYEGWWTKLNSIELSPSYHYLNKDWCKYSYSDKPLKVYVDPIIETAWKEKWIGLFYSNAFCEELGYPQMFGLPTFSRKEIHKLKTFIKPKEFKKYHDYIVLGHSTYHNWSHDNYFRSDWKHEHDRIIDELNQISEKEKMLHEEKVRKQIEFLEKNVGSPITIEKAKDLAELKAIGKRQNNCIGVVYTNPDVIYKVFIGEIEISAHFYNNKLQEARLLSNKEVPKDVFECIERKLIDYETR